MKLMLAATALAVAVASPATAATLYDNGAIVDASGRSVLTSPATTFGAGSNADARLADNFSVTGAGWNVQSLDFYGYQTQTGTGVFTFTNVAWSVLRGTDVNTAVLVTSGTTAVTNGGLVGYRVLSTDLNNQQRAIFRISADVADFNLTAGNYFLTWQLAGSGASGPFVPPIKLGSGNALQSLAGAAYTPLTDAGSLQNFDVPFTINGVVAGAAVPEPASWAMMILGVGALGATLRRGRRTTTRVSFAA